MHVVFGFVWFVVWFVWAYFTSFAGDATTVFLLAFLTWFLAAGIVVWRWRSGSRWYGLVPAGWLAVLLAATEIGRPSEFLLPW